jgi:hypothetical protein
MAAEDIAQQRGWIDLYQPSDKVGSFLTAERVRLENTLRELGLVEATSAR